MRLAPPVTKNRSPAMYIPVLRCVPSCPLPPFVGEEDDFRSCFYAEYPLTDDPIDPAGDQCVPGLDGHQSTALHERDSYDRHHARAALTGCQVSAVRPHLAAVPAGRAL